MLVEMMITRTSLFIMTRLTSVMRHFHGNLSIQSKVELGSQMKHLNDQKQFKRALSLFDSYKQSEVSDLAINQALQACIHLRDFRRGSFIHQQLSSRSFKCRHIQTSLVQLFTRCGDIELAQRIFSSIPSRQRTPFLYTAMINGLVWNNRSEEALTLVEQMTAIPDQYIFTIVFTTCPNLATERATNLARKMFARMPENYFKDPIVMNAALDMFWKIGDVQKVKEIFASIKSKDLVTYGAMIKGYYSKDNPMEALTLFQQMKRDGIKLDLVMFILIVQACSQIGMIDYCRSIAAEIPKEFLENQILQSTLIDMWGKASLVDEAERVFKTIHNPDSTSYGAMINAYGCNGMDSSAVNLYRRMPSEMRNHIVALCALNACSHSGLLEEARSIFNEIFDKTEKITTTMIDCLSRMHRFDEAENLLVDFEAAHAPYPPMYLAIMSGARTQWNSSLSERFFRRMKELFPHSKDDLVSASVLLANTYSYLSDQSRILKKQIRESGIRPQVGRSWTCINGKVFEFRAHDRSHPQSEEIYREIVSLSKEIVELGHKFDARWITRALGNDETVESVLSGHSERLAIAFNLIQKTIPSPIQITENLRICGDCHAAIKLIARARQRQIIVRDANRIHHFHPDGQCSCRDYF